MIRSNVGWFAAYLSALFACAGAAQAADIGGRISTTLTITADSQLVDDVICTVTTAPCIAIGAPNVKLELNGFTMTGQADPQTGCSRVMSWAPSVDMMSVQSSKKILYPLVTVFAPGSRNKGRWI